MLPRIYDEPLTDSNSPAFKCILVGLPWPWYQQTLPCQTLSSGLSMYFTITAAKDIEVPRFSCCITRKYHQRSFVFEILKKERACFPCCALSINPALFHFSPNAEDNMARCITKKYDTLEPNNP